jgi:hypothetical protein
MTEPTRDNTAECTRAHLHTRCPSGYLAWHEWAEKKSRRHYQVKCPGCGRFAIWKRKEAVSDGE